MDEGQADTLEEYQRKGLAARCGYGVKPVLLVVDFINGFTDASTPLGGDFSNELAVTGELLTEFRRGGLPIVFTTVAYESDLRDAGMWIKKIPSLEILRKGTNMVEVDERIRPRYGEYVLEKKFASSFFGTDLDPYLKGRGVDTIIMTGCTTSGCIRASAIDSIQYGFHTIVVRDAVGDRAEAPHQANLLDIEGKYGDVVPSREVLDFVRAVVRAGGLATKAHDEFRLWWAAPSKESRLRRQRMKLHVIKPSVNNMTVRVFVRAAGLDVEEVDAYGQTRTEEFLGKCPAHLTPMLEAEELPNGAMWESCAIMQYLCNKHGLTQFYPDAPALRATNDSAMLYLTGTFYPLVVRATYPALRFPLYPGEVGASEASDEDKEAARQAAQDALAEPLEVFKSFFLADRDFIGGSTPSIADMRLAGTLEFLNAIDYALPDWAQAYISAMENALGAAYAEPAADVRGYIDYVKSQAS